MIDARTQPDVLQPETITVSTPSLMKYAATEVLKKDRCRAFAHGHVVALVVDALVKFGTSVAVAEIANHRRNFPEWRIARTRISRVTASDRQPRFARRGDQRDGIVDRAFDHRPPAKRKATFGKSPLKIDHNDAGTPAEADAAGAESTVEIRIAHVRLPMQF